MFLRLFENFVKFPFYSLSLRGIRHYSPRFPLREPLSNCRFKAISASKVARSADRGLFKTSPYVAASPCFFLLSQKSAKIVSRYAASPRGEAPPRGGGEGRNLFSIRIISIKGYNLFVSLLLSRQVKWRAAPIEVYLKFRLMLRLPLASIKFCLTSSLPLGGKVDKAKLWTNEGRILFSIRLFSIKGCNLFVSLLLSPLGILVELPF